MRRALVACLALAIGGTPLGTFMALRRMALVGDAMSHAILPGVSIAFLFFGLSIWPMTFGGLAAGILVALCAVMLTRVTQLKEDASFTLSYLLSIATGVVILSLKGSNVDLLHMLFGDILAIDNNALNLVTAIATITLFALAFIYRGLVIECFDPDFMRASRRGSGWISQIFFVLVVLNLVSAFQALGTLMALGIILLPAIAAKFWTRSVDAAIPLSIAMAVVASFVGLLLSYHIRLPSGPAVILVAAFICVFSVVCGRFGSLTSYVLNRD